MRKSAFPSRIAKLVATITLLSLLASSVGVFFPLRVAGEPKPRPTPPPEPYIQLYPTEAVGLQEVSINVTGHLWGSNAPAVTLAWDVFDGAHLLAQNVPVDADGNFQRTVTVQAGWATPGEHWVIASNDGAFFARASIRLLLPTPTNTAAPSDTPAPKPPTDTPVPTQSPTPSPTLRPVTPIVTGTVTRLPPPQATKPPVIPQPTSPPVPQPTSTPRPTHTPWPTPTPTDTPTLTPTPTPTDTPTLTPTPTPTDTPTLTPTPTPTDTPTSTPTPTPTAGPGTPVAALPTAPGAGLPGTGGATVGTDFFEGFIAAILLVVLLTAFIIVVLIILLVVWRILRMRQIQERAGG